MVEKIENGKIYDTRLSNGPIESLNRKIKDLKRLGRGFRNFEHFRNRFLYATRALPVLNGVSDYNPNFRRKISWKTIAHSVKIINASTGLIMNSQDMN